MVPTQRQGCASPGFKKRSPPLTLFRDVNTLAVHGTVLLEKGQTSQQQRLHTSACASSSCRSPTFRAAMQKEKRSRGVTASQRSGISCISTLSRTAKAGTRKVCLPSSRRQVEGNDELGVARAVAKRSVRVLIRQLSQPDPMRSFLPSTSHHMSRRSEAQPRYPSCRTLFPFTYSSAYARPAGPSCWPSY